MQSLYRNFYRHLYLRSPGYIPTMPDNRNILPGDFFQIRNGGLIVLGNIFRNGVIDKGEAEISAGIKLNPSGWNFGDGVTKAYSSRGVGEGPIGGQFQFSQQVLAFKEKGSFLFAGNNPEAVKIMNWTDLAQQLIIRMTQGLYSFREVYVVTECVSLSDYTLVVSGSSSAELEIATDTENFGLVDIFGHASARTIQSKDIEYYHREHIRKPLFCKARKLTVPDDRKMVFVNELVSSMQRLHEGEDDILGYAIEDNFSYPQQVHVDAQDSILDMLGANELNPNKALHYFKWAEANMDDVEKLFISYGNNR